jgi:hypothetical protein
MKLDEITTNDELQEYITTECMNNDIEILRLNMLNDVNLAIIDDLQATNDIYVHTLNYIVSQLQGQDTKLSAHLCKLITHRMKLNPIYT